MPSAIRSFLPALATAALAAFSGPAHADQPAGMQARGRPVRAVLGIFEPFGYADPRTRSMAGYGVDLCHATGQRLGVQVRPIP